MLVSRHDLRPRRGAFLNLAKRVVDGVGLAAAVLGQALVAPSSGHIVVDIGRVQWKAVDLHAAPGVHGTAAQSLRRLATEGAAKAPEFAAFRVRAFQRSNAEWIVIGCQTVFVRQAAEFGITLAAEHNVVQVDAQEEATNAVDHVPLVG